MTFYNNSGIIEKDGFKSTVFAELTSGLMLTLNNIRLKMFKLK